MLYGFNISHAVVALKDTWPLPIALSLLARSFVPVATLGSSGSCFHQSFWFFHAIKLSIINGFKSVQPIGQFINHSTQGGFSCPGCPSGTARYCAAGLPFCRSLQEYFLILMLSMSDSLALGVGNFATFVARSSPPDFSRFILAKSGPDGLPFGVGHFCPLAAPTRD